jgi:dTMP kinase
MAGLFITFEGTEGSGKSTQIERLSKRLKALGHDVITLREPGGTPIGEEIRHTLKHSAANAAMFAETELLLMNASRAQLVREVIRPALDKGKIILCDRFYDSSIVYQGYGRMLEMAQVEKIIDFAVGDTRPCLTLLLTVPLEVSEARRAARKSRIQAPRDRMEEADRGFFTRVEQGYRMLEEACGNRIKGIDATQSIEAVEAEIWRWVEPLLKVPAEQGERAYKSIGEYRKEPPG